MSEWILALIAYAALVGIIVVCVCVGARRAE